MRVITTKRLSDFWERHADVEGELKTWIYEAEHSSWKSTKDIKARYGSADFLGDNRVVFNIKGNHYRLIVKIHYNTGLLYVRFIGNHAEYTKLIKDQIVETI